MFDQVDERFPAEHQPEHYVDVDEYNGWPGAAVGKYPAPIQSVTQGFSWGAFCKLYLNCSLYESQKR